MSAAVSLRPNGERPIPELNLNLAAMKSMSSVRVAWQATTEAVAGSAEFAEGEGIE